MSKNLKIVLTGTLICSAVFTVLTIERNNIWKDEVIFWKDNIKKSPNKSRPHNNLASVYIRQGRFNDALPHLKKSLQLDPQYSQAHLNTGLVYLNQSQWEKAYSSLMKAYEMEPTDQKVILNLGLAYFHLDQKGRAETLWKKAIAQSKFLISDIPKSLAVLFIKQKRYAEAINLYEQILNNYPHEYAISEKLIELYLYTDRIREAEKLGKDAIVKIHNTALLNQIASHYLRHNLPEYALNYYERSLKVNNYNEQAYIGLSKLLVKLNSSAEAISTLKEGKEMFPHSKTINKLLEELSRPNGT